MKNSDLERFDIDIDLVNAYQEGMTFDEFEEEIQTLISQEEVIYYHTAMKYLSENDPSLCEAFELASDMGYETRNLNSELLATILLQQRLSEQWQEIRDEIEEMFEEAEDESKV